MFSNPGLSCISGELLKKINRDPTNIGKRTMINLAASGKS
jgi:hypothetical protein